MILRSYLGADLGVIQINNFMSNQPSEEAGNTPAPELDIETANFTPEQLEAAFANLSNPQPEPLVEPVEQTPPAPTEEDDVTVDDKKGGRIRLTGPAFKMARLIKEGVDPAEALRTAYPDSVPPQESMTSTEAHQTEPQVTESERIEQEIEALTAQQVEKLELYENDEAAQIASQIVKLQKQFARAAAQEAIAEDRKQQALEAQFQAEQDKHAVQATQDYPDFAKPESLFAQRAQEIHQWFASRNDPRLNEPDYAYKLAEMVAKEQGVVPVIPTKLAPMSQTAATPQKKAPVTQLPGTLGVSSPPPTPPVDIEEFYKGASAADLEILARQVMARTLGK